MLASSESSVVNFCEEENLLKDEEQLLRIFPEEIWRMLLEKIEEDSNDDLVNTVNASLYFRSLLLRRRVQFLFPKVWGILGMKFEVEMKDEEDEFANKEPKDNHDDSREGAMEEDGGEDGKEGDTWFHSILKLRLVCRRWRDAVDGFYHNLPHYYNMKHDDPKKGIIKRPKNSEEDYVMGSWLELDDLYFGNVSYLTEFMRHFENSHHGGTASDGRGGRNPFFTRSIRYLEYGFENTQFLNELFAFLSKYGHHIWYCCLNTEDGFPSIAAYYSKLKEILQLLPNLKVLEIQYYRAVNYYSDDATMSFREVPLPRRTPEDLTELQSEIEMNPFQDMRDLQFLKTKGLPVYIFNEFIRASENLTMMEVGTRRYGEDYDFFTRPLPKLKKLFIRFDSEDHFMRMGLPEVNWRLENLYLDFNHSPFIPWSRVFSLLGDKFGGTLTNLTMVLPKTEVESEEKTILKESISLRLELPHLKRLKLTVNNCTSWDFLLPMKDSLEDLDLTIYCDFRRMEKKYKEIADSVEAGQVIIIYDDYLHGKKVRECNVWTQFPKLARLNCHEDYSTSTGRAFRRRSGHGRSLLFYNRTRKHWLEEMKKQSGVSN